MLKKLMSRIYDNSLFIAIGLVYYFSLNGITVGDLFYRNLENGYPLFLSSNWEKWPAWLGFDFAHILNVPTLRAIQVLLAEIGLIPGPLLLMQSVNLLLALASLIFLQKLLLNLNINAFTAKLATLLFAFSYAFYANMNAEIHHFSVLLIAAALWMLTKIENSHINSRASIFFLCVCLSLAPLYHLESIVFSGLMFVYLFFNIDLRRKLLARIPEVLIGLILVPLLLLISSFVFSYFDSGAVSIDAYVRNSPMLNRLAFQANTSVAGLVNSPARNVYGMMRAFLESFSVLSRMLPIIPQYNQVVSYVNPLFVNIAIANIISYLIILSLTMLFAVYFLLANWRKIEGLVKLLAFALGVYLAIFGFLVGPVFHLSEFFIVPSMILCILFGRIFNKTGSHAVFLFLLLVLLTVFSNIFWFVFPQKVSAQSLNSIVSRISFDNPKQNAVIIRAGNFDFPYEAGFCKNVQIVSDEHAYESKIKTIEHLAMIDDALHKGKKVYLVGPAFLLDARDLNTMLLSVLNGRIGIENNNFLYLLNKLQSRQKVTISKDYLYNWGGLGLLGKVDVLELQLKRAVI